MSVLHGPRLANCLRTVPKGDCGCRIRSVSAARQSTTPHSGRECRHERTATNRRPSDQNAGSPVSDIRDHLTALMETAVSSKITSRETLEYVFRKVWRNGTRTGCVWRR